MEKTYNWTEEVPEWARPTVQKLLDKGYLKGNDKGELELTYSMLKLLVINDRAGLYNWIMAERKKALTPIKKGMRAFFICLNYFSVIELNILFPFLFLLVLDIFSWVIVVVYIFVICPGFQLRVLLYVFQNFLKNDWKTFIIWVFIF